MDFDGSLTPPMSPQSGSDSEPMEGSPVLVGKQRSVHDQHTLRETESSPLCKVYSPSVSCSPAIFSTQYVVEKLFEDSIIKRANEAWNLMLFNDFDQVHHKRDECWREVMETRRCLNELVDANECTDMFYEGLVHFQDLEDLAKSWTKGPMSNMSHYTLVAKKHRKYIGEMLAFVGEYIQRNSSSSSNSQTEPIIHIFNLMVMMSNETQVVIQDGFRAIVKTDLDGLGFGNSSRSNPVKEWLHVYVDINTAFLQMMPILHKIPGVSEHIEMKQLHFHNGCEITEQDFCWKFIKNIFSEMTIIAMEKYLQLSLTSSSDKGHFVQALLFNNSPFPCQCAQQLMSLCLHVAVRIVHQRKMDEQMFFGDSIGNRITEDSQYQPSSFEMIGSMIWKILMSFVNSIIQETQNRLKSVNSNSVPQGPSFPQFSSTTDALSFSWWWTWHVGHLFLFDMNGNYQPDSDSPPSCLPLISRLIRSSLTTCENDHKLLASHLICYRAISSFWRGSTQTHSNISTGELAQFQQLWAFFSRKMNMITKSSKPGMHKFTTKEDRGTSPTSWLKKCNQILKMEKTTLADSTQTVHEDSFEIFLQILGEILNQGCWVNIKDRFFSRFLPIEMKNLSETGLSRLFHLFLLTASATEDRRMLTELFTKLLECLGLVYLGKTDYRKQRVMLTGLFSCMRLSAPNLMNMSEICSKCGKIISSVCKLFSESGHNMDQRHSLWKVISCFLQNLSELCQITSSFSLGQHLMIPQNSLKSALGKVRQNESVIVYETLTNMFSSIVCHIKQSANKESVSGALLLFSNIGNQVLPWLKERATVDETYSEEIVNTVLEICQIVLQTQTTMREHQAISQISISSLIEYFGTNVDVKLRNRYLFALGILSQEVILNFLNQKKLSEAEAACLATIQGSIKCCVSHKDEGDKNILVNSLAQLDTVKEVFHSVGNSSNKLTFPEFLRAIEERYGSCKTFLERKEKKDEASSWFNALTEVLHSFSKSVSSSSMDRDEVLNVYLTCGQIFQHLSKILYLTGKSGIISQMLDTLILPRSIYSSRDVALQPHLLRALGQTLHMYLKSLLFLDYKRDSYLQRVLYNIVSIYLNKFPTANTSHPFLKVLNDPSLSSEQRKALVKLMSDSTQGASGQNEKLSKVIEILHLWASHKDGHVDTKEIFQALPSLEKARTTFRDVPAIAAKINLLIKLTQIKTD